MAKMMPMPSAGTRKAEKPLMEKQGSGTELLLRLPTYTLLLTCRACFYKLKGHSILAQKHSIP